MYAAYFLLEQLLLLFGGYLFVLHFLVVNVLQLEPIDFLPFSFDGRTVDMNPYADDFLFCQAKIVIYTYHVEPRRESEQQQYHLCKIQVFAIATKRGCDIVHLRCNQLFKFVIDFLIKVGDHFPVVMETIRDHIIGHNQYICDKFLYFHAYIRREDVCRQR